MVLEREETTLKTFNAAKKFAEEILFPLMEQYQLYQRQSDFGAGVLQDSLNLPTEIRDIERYNGLKAMRDVCSNLALAIKSTVIIKNNKEEIDKLNEIIEHIDIIKNIFADHKERFFTTTTKNDKLVEVINNSYFEKVKRNIQICYINIEILMTRNKLLFADAKDEYQDDAEIQEEIIKEYTEG